MAALARHRRTWRRDDAGAELVEFALVFPLLLLVVLGMIDFGLLFQQEAVLTNAAREGARIAVLPNYTSADATTRVAQYVQASLISQGQAVTTTVGAPVAVPIGTHCMSTVTVTLSYPHRYLFLGGIARYFHATFGTKTLRVTATMRREAAAVQCS